MTDLSVQRRIAAAGPRPVRAPRGSDISCANWLIEAAYRMIQHNLAPDVAERPEDGASGVEARHVGNGADQRPTLLVAQ